ncbi:D-alanyl-D-alanine carboxypeptidase family protein [Peptostreptococcus faecalis]|uniref:D-alanyl-D-alanine carboxypeptidase family protein n=1 Tax=Peptostreptococcus faecalis TaxID=2045015 RepID=UPI000C7C64F2|nr:D-alanyl-D-alanine carboxypeptidase family protein [Peptostreptococcus faecalis]
MKKSISIFSALILSFNLVVGSTVLSNADEKAELDSLKSKYIVLMDYNSGKILYEKNAEKKMYPASTTKIWTAFCALKKAKNLNEEIEITDMPEVEGSSMSLENGEKFTLLQLLQSLLVHSSNDVGYVLAKHYGNGDPKKFIDFMNEEASKYGAKNTHFNNPHGLPDTDHYTTAMDMTTLSRVAYSNETIKNIVAMKSVSFNANENSKFDRLLINSNKFLTSTMTMDYKGKNIPIKYDIVDGMKTGFTDDAGNCLVSTAEKNGVRLIGGIFFAPSGSLYHDSRTILDYGFDNYKTVKVLKKEDYKGEKKVNFAKPGTIKYTLANDYSVTTSKNESFSKKDYTKKYDFDKLNMPVKKGDIIGTLNVYNKGTLVSNIALVAENGSQTYFQYLLSFLPFGKDDKSSEQKEDNTSNQKEDKKESKKDSDAEAKKDDKKSKSESTASKLKSLPEKFTSEISNSFKGITSFFSEIKDFIVSIFNSNGLEEIEKNNLYKFLDKKIKSKIDFIPSKIIILGTPLLIILIILILIVSIIRDKIKRKFSSKKKRKSELSVEDITPIEEISPSEIKQDELKQKYNVKEIDNDDIENKDDNN